MTTTTKKAAAKKSATKKSATKKAEVQKAEVKKREPAVSPAQAEAAMGRIKDGKSSLKAESTRLGFARNGPLRAALRALIGKDKYVALMAGRQLKRGSAGNGKTAAKTPAAKKAAAKKPAAKKAAVKKPAAKTAASPQEDTA